MEDGTEGLEMHGASSVKRKEAEITSLNALPEKSKRIYQSTYESFCKWKQDHGRQFSSEVVLLAYFRELATKKQCSTLYSNYSMLKTTINIYEKVNIECYSKLQAFLKLKSQCYKPKKCKIFTAENVKDFLNTAPDVLYLPTKVALVMGVIGGCPCDELYQLKVADLQDLGEAYGVTVMSPVTTKPRRFFIANPHYELVKRYVNERHTQKYPITDNDILFMQYRSGKFINHRVGINTFRSMGREIATFLKLPNPKDYAARSICKTSKSIFVDAIGNFTQIPGRNSTVSKPETTLSDNAPQSNVLEFQEIESPELDKMSDLSGNYEIHIEEHTSPQCPQDIKPDVDDLEVTEQLSSNQSNNNIIVASKPAVPTFNQSTMSTTTSALGIRPVATDYSSSPTGDEFYMFGMSVASQLRNMQFDNALLAQFKIQQQITEIRLKLQSGSNNLNFNGMFH